MMDGCTDTWIDRWLHRSMNKRRDKTDNDNQIERLTNGRMDKERYEDIERGRLTDGWIKRDKQTMR